MKAFFFLPFVGSIVIHAGCYSVGYAPIFNDGLQDVSHVFRSMPLWHLAGLQDQTLHNPVSKKVVQLRSQHCPNIGQHCDGNFLR